MKNNSIVIGGIAGGVDVLITMPLDTIKNYKQISNISYMNIINQLYIKNGFFGFYKGFLPFFIQSIGKSSIRFYSYNYINNYLTYLINDDNNKSNIDQSNINQSNINKSDINIKDIYKINMISGFLSGITESLICTVPTERLKILQQNNNYNYYYFIKKNIINKNIFTFYKGSIATILKQSSSVTLRFTSYEYFKNELNSMNYINKSNIPFIAGGLCGSFSCLINNPIDVLKTRMQSDQNNKNIVYHIKKINKDGKHYWFNGLGFRFPRLFISQAIQFSIYEYLMNI